MRRKKFFWAGWLLLTVLARDARADKHLSTTMSHNLEASLRHLAPREGAALAAQAARLLRWRGDITRVLHPGDTLSLLYTSDAHEPLLEALHYHGSQVSLDAYAFVGKDGIRRYYDHAGARIEPELLSSPVPKYVQITETVQHGRGKRNHRGIDLKAPEGSAIVLPYSGTVRRTNWGRRMNGRCIEIFYHDGHIAHFLHLASLAPDIRPGARLEAGHLLGKVGNTGHSSAAHLHYEVLKGRRVLEPLTVHGRRWVHLSPVELPAFGAACKRMDAALKGS